MMNDEGVRCAWPLNWLCIELLVMKSHVLYMWYTPGKHVRCSFLNISLRTPHIQICTQILSRQF